jgi:hypothetical protein
MGNNLAFRMFGTECFDVGRLEHLMHRAVTFPQQNFCIADLFLGEAATWLIRIPNHHLIQRDAALMPGPAT